MKQLSLDLGYRPTSVRDYVRDRLRGFEWRQQARAARRERRRARRRS